MSFTYNRGRLCFFIDGGDRTHCRLLRRELLYHLSYIATYYDVLPLLLNEVLLHPIQHAKYLSPAGYSVVFHDPCITSFNATHRPFKLRTSPRLQHLGQTPLPFLIHANKLVLLGSQHHLLLFMHPGSLAGQSMHILSLTLALHLSPPVLWTKTGSPQ
jgi:hypothetical protein